MDWKEFFRPTIGKLILPSLYLIIIVYSHFFLYPIRSTLNLLILLVIFYLFSCILSTWRYWPSYWPSYWPYHYEDRVKYEHQLSQKIGKNIFLIFGIGIICILIGIILLIATDTSISVFSGVRFIVLGVLALLAFLIYMNFYRKKKKLHK